MVKLRVFDMVRWDEAGEESDAQAIPTRMRRRRNKVQAPHKLI